VENKLLHLDDSSETLVRIYETNLCHIPEDHKTKYSLLRVSQILEGKMPTFNIVAGLLK